MRNPISILIILCSLALTSCTQCGGNSQPRTDDDRSTAAQTKDKERMEDNQENNTQNSDNPLAQLQKSVEELTGKTGETVEPINFREIQKTLFAEKIGAFKLDDKTGSSSGALGFSFSETTASYIDADGKKVEVKVTDAGGLGAGLMSLTAWSLVSIDEEDKNGWKKSGTFLGFKSFEEFTKRNGESKVSLIVDNRFVYEASALCPMEDLKSFIKKMGPKKLETLI